MPILATLLLFYAVAHWNDFFNALIFLNDQAKYPIQLHPAQRRDPGPLRADQ